MGNIMIQKWVFALNIAIERQYDVSKWLKMAFFYGHLNGQYDHGPWWTDLGCYKPGMPGIKKNPTNLLLAV